MRSPLQETSHAYRLSTESADRLMLEHEEAMACRDLEELIVVGLCIQESYNRIDGRWRDDVKQRSNLLEHGIELKAIADEISESRSTVLRLIASMESRGFYVLEASAFRSTRFEPFESRALDVAFSGAELHALATVGPKAPDTVCEADDGL